MVERKTPHRPPREDDKRQTPSNNHSIDYGEGKRGNFEVSPTRPAPAPRKPDRGQGDDEG